MGPWGFVGKHIDLDNEKENYGNRIINRVLERVCARHGGN